MEKEKQKKKTVLSILTGNFKRIFGKTKESPKLKLKKNENSGWDAVGYFVEGEGLLKKKYFVKYYEKEDEFGISNFKFAYNFVDLLNSEGYPKDFRIRIPKVRKNDDDEVVTIVKTVGNPYSSVVIMFDCIASGDFLDRKRFIHNQDEFVRFFKFLRSQTKSIMRKLKKKKGIEIMEEDISDFSEVRWRINHYRKLHALKKKVQHKKTAMKRLYSFYDSALSKITCKLIDVILKSYSKTESDLLENEESSSSSSDSSKESSLTFCHTDVHFGNCLVDGKIIYLFDWDYAACSNFERDLAHLSLLYSKKENFWKFLKKMEYEAFSKRLFHQVFLVNSLENSIGLVKRFALQNFESDYESEMKSNILELKKELNKTLTDYNER